MPTERDTLDMTDSDRTAELARIARDIATVSASSYEVVLAALSALRTCTMKNCDHAATLGMTVLLAGLRIELDLCEEHFDRLDQTEKF